MKILLLMREENNGYANDCYLKALEKYGAEVIECFYSNHYEDLLGMLSQVDGVLLTGGDDASIMGLFIINYCVRNNKKLLGICLGMQEMCIYSSNDKLVSIGDLRHSVEDNSYVHDVLIDKDSKLSKILGETRIKVNSHHKQTLERSNYFKAVGYSDDGLIEAVEGDGDFQIGVQWHPERMIDYDVNSVKLFKAFLNCD